MGSPVMCGPRPERGVTLVEVLVGLLVLSLGVLGVAGSQLLSLETQRGTHRRVQAVALAAGILDTLRANPTVAAAYVGRYPDEVAAAGDGACLTPGGCSSAQMAQHDRAGIARLLPDAAPVTAVDGAVLPGARVDVRPGGAPGEFRVRVSWYERHATATVSHPGTRTRTAVETAIELAAVITP